MSNQHNQDIGIAFSLHILDLTLFETVDLCGNLGHMLYV